MADGTLQGLTAAYAIIDALPSAADKELGKDLVDIAEVALTAQRAAVPEDTGALRAGLSVQLLIDQLRVRVGLIGLRNRSGKQNFGSLFYGVIVNFGRKAQVVPVQRRRNGTAKLSRRNRLVSLTKQYSMNVRAMEGREFIDPPGLTAQVDTKLADFWARTFTNAGAAA